MEVGRSTIYLVRHAKAGSRSNWKGSDRKRPLVDEGRRQAEQIAQRLARVASPSLLTSPYVRCRQTLEPLAELLGCELVDDDALVEGQDPLVTLDMITSASAGAVLCSHGDVIGEILLHLIRTGVPIPATPAKLRKGSTLEIDREGGRIIAARYVEAPTDTSGHVEVHAEPQPGERDMD